MSNGGQPITPKWLAAHQTLEHFVDATEAANFIGVKRRTSLKMARDGVIPAHPLGDGVRKQWRFRLSELDEWLRNRVNSARPCSRERSNVR